MLMQYAHLYVHIFPGEVFDLNKRTCDYRQMKHRSPNDPPHNLLNNDRIYNLLVEKASSVISLCT